MLGLIFLYYIGKAYHNLAFHYGKENCWVFAVLGITMYYISTIVVGGLVVGVALAYFSPETLTNTSETVLGILCVPFGLLGCWALYKFLEKRWNRSYELVSNANLLDDNF